MRQAEADREAEAARAAAGAEAARAVEQGAAGRTHPGRLLCLVCVCVCVCLYLCVCVCVCLYNLSPETAKRALLTRSCRRGGPTWGSRSTTRLSS